MIPPLRVVAVVVLVLGPLAGAAPGSAADGVTVESVTYGGEFVTPPEERFLVWRSNDHEFTVRVASDTALEDGAVCLLVNSTDGPRELGCRTVTLDPGDDRAVPVQVDAWPADLIGPRVVAAVVRDRATGTRLASARLSLVVGERSGDLDGDGLSNDAEVDAGTDPLATDTDGDGLDDGIERRTHGTDPLVTDTDGDGLDDGEEVVDSNTDPTAADTDDDGFPDGREVEFGTVPTRTDTDGDGLDDGAEVNRYQTDPTLADTDGDGLADGAEIDEFGTNPLEADTDGDGLADGQEVHVHGTDPVAADTDGDGFPDRTEIVDYHTDPTTTDTDGDGLGDSEEVDGGTDPLTADTDRDGLPDGREVELGSDPADPASTADPGLTRRAIRTVADRPLLAGVVAGLVLVTGGVLGARRFGRLTVPLELRSPGERAEPAETEESGRDDEPAEPDHPDHPDDGPTGASEPAADTRIMTNEERVARLLEEHDGRMLQSEMVDAADWSKATVSRVLSRMEQEGAVTRVDIGRGNLVTRPEDEPPSAESPFDG